MINLENLQELRSSIFLSERMFHADLLNSSSGQWCEGIEALYWKTAKVHLQMNNLVDCISSVHEKLIDFAAGNFDKYIDEHNKFKDSDEDEFDPYEELEYCMNNTDWIYSLPSKISDYPELLKFSLEFTIREKAKSIAFKQCFPGLEMNYISKDNDGETILIPESEMPESIKNYNDANEEIRHIEVEHCLDNYDKWRECISEMILRKGSFSEMLALFK